MNSRCWTTIGLVVFGVAVVGGFGTRSVQAQPIRPKYRTVLSPGFAAFKTGLGASLQAGTDRVMTVGDTRGLVRVGSMFQIRGPVTRGCMEVVRAKSVSARTGNWINVVVDAACSHYQYETVYFWWEGPFEGPLCKGDEYFPECLPSCTSTPYRQGSACIPVCGTPNAPSNYCVPACAPNQTPDGTCAKAPSPPPSPAPSPPPSPPPSGGPPPGSPPGGPPPGGPPGSPPGSPPGGPPPGGPPGGPPGCPPPYSGAPPRPGCPPAPPR